MQCKVLELNTSVKQIPAPFNVLVYFAHIWKIDYGFSIDKFDAVIGKRRS